MSTPTKHDAGIFLMGGIGSSDRFVTNHDSDPATFKAGLIVHRSATGGLSLASSDGGVIGVSLGESLQDTKRTAVCRVGNDVPVQLTNEGVLSNGTATITSYANLVDSGDDTIQIGSTVFTAQSGAASLGDATFQAATSNDDTAQSLSDQINAHPVASLVVSASALSAVVTITAIEPGTGSNSIELIYTDNGTSSVGATVSGSGTLENGTAAYAYALPGKPVIYSATTGKAASTGNATGGIYKGDVLRGLQMDESFVDVILVDMGGGL